MLMLFPPLKNMATSEFSWYIKCKPLLLLFCSHNYFSNQQYLHVWCSCILGGPFHCLYYDWNLWFSNSIINSIILIINSVLFPLGNSILDVQSGYEGAVVSGGWKANVSAYATELVQNRGWLMLQSSPIGSPGQVIPYFIHWRNRDGLNA